MKQMEVLERRRRSPEVVSACSLQYISKLLPGKGTEGQFSYLVLSQASLPAHFNPALHLHITPLTCLCSEMLVTQLFQSHTALPSPLHLGLQVCLALYPLVVNHLTLTLPVHLVFWGMVAVSMQKVTLLSFDVHSMFPFFLFDFLQENFNCLRVPYQS